MGLLVHGITIVLFSTHVPQFFHKLRWQADLYCRDIQNLYFGNPFYGIRVFFGGKTCPKLAQEVQEAQEVVFSDMFEVPLADRTKVRGCFALWKRDLPHP